MHIALILANPIHFGANRKTYDPPFYSSREEQNWLFCIALTDVVFGDDLKIILKIFRAFRAFRGLIWSEKRYFTFQSWKGKIQIDYYTEIRYGVIIISWINED